MKITLASTFRDSTGYIDRYFHQCHELQRVAKEKHYDLGFLWGENDSVDDTKNRLLHSGFDAHVVDCSTGAPYYQSRESHQARWSNVAAYSNATLAHVPKDCDVLLWVECDIVWGPYILLALAVQAPRLGVVAAPVYMEDGRFYDTHTSRIDGRPVTPGRNVGLVHYDSCAGCLAVRGDLARSVPFPDDACLGWVRDMGGAWVDTDLEVKHP